MAPPKEKEPEVPAPKLLALDFWAAFKKSGAGARCFERIKALEQRLGVDSQGHNVQPNESQIEAIFLDCLTNSTTYEIMRDDALAQLTAANWAEVGS